MRNGLLSTLDHLHSFMTQSLLIKQTETVDLRIARYQSITGPGHQRQAGASSVVGDRTGLQPALHTAGRSRFAAPGVAADALPRRGRRRLRQSAARPRHHDRVPTPRPRCAAASLALGSSPAERAARALL